MLSDLLALEYILTKIGLSKRDKRRQQISSRLNKLELTFNNDKDNFYKLLLQNLQNNLATLQQGTNEEFVQKRRF